MTQPPADQTARKQQRNADNTKRLTVSGFFSRLNRSRKRRLDTLSLALTRALYRQASALDPSTYQTVCLLMQDHGIGDAIAVSGLVKLLRDSGRTVIIWTNRSTAQVFRSLIPTDGLFILDRKRRKKIGLKPVRQTIDLLIDLSFYANYHKLERVRLISWIKPKHTIGFNGDVDSLHDTTLRTRKSEHVSHRFAGLAKALGLTCQPYRYDVRFDTANVAASDNFILSLRKRYRHIVVFNPFGGGSNRRLSTAQIDAICHHLESRPDTATIVFCMGADLNTARFKNVLSNPFPDLENSFNLVRRSDIVVTVDTAIVHLAAAFDIRQYAIYNNRVTPINDNNRVWAPNSSKATQLTTTSYDDAVQGDDIATFDVGLLFSALD